MPCNNKLYSHRSEMKYFFQAILLSYFVAALANSNLSTKQAKNADNGTTKSSHCNVNNYFYAGPNSKKIEDMFSEVKQQLAELNSKKIEDMFSEVKQQLAELNSTKIEDMFSEVKQQLAELKDEIGEMKENQTWCQGGRVYKTCADVYQSGDKISGVYKIDPDGKGEFEVFCDQKTAGGGWTVFQKRRDGSVDFYRAWDDYKRGFGDLKGEFWLGLDKIHRLTVSSSNKLRVDLEDKVFAEYSSFSVASERGKYQLNLRSYSGTAGDSLSYHRGSAFSTKDRDNDAWSSNCVVFRKGAWWYKDCAYSNLNGLYLNGKINHEGMSWYHWKNSQYSVKKSEMKIRPKDF